MNVSQDGSFQANIELFKVQAKEEEEDEDDYDEEDEVGVVEHIVDNGIGHVQQKK